MKEKCHFCEYERGPLLDKLTMCKTCHDNSNFQIKNRLSPRASYEYEKLRKDEEWINDKSASFDRDTALQILSELSHRMHPSTDLFGEGTLVISRYNFEIIRKKYLDRDRKDNK